MKLATDISAINLKSLGFSLGLLLAAGLAATGSIAALDHYMAQAEAEHKQTLAKQKETHARLMRAHEDKREIRENIAHYSDIVSRGRTQPERRLEWVETLRNIKTSRRLLGMEYEIAPQRLLDEKQPMTGGYSFLVSPMKLDMPLLHEDDLLGVLSDLAAQAQALVSVRSCRIEHLGADAIKSNTANLKATCEIDWITLQEKT